MQSISRRAGALLFAATVVAGCGSSGDDGGMIAGATSDSASTPGSGGSATSTGPSSSSAQTPQGVDDAVAALRAAAVAVTNGRPFDIERDTYQGQPVWEIKVASDGNEFELYISADGSQVLRQAQDNDPDDDVQKMQQVQVDAVDALQTAAAQHQDAVLDEMEVDTASDGTVVWEIEFKQADGSEVEVEVNAVTGEIVR